MKKCVECQRTKDESQFKKSGSGKRTDRCHSCIWQKRVSEDRTGRDAVPQAPVKATGGMQDDEDPQYWFDRERGVYAFTEARITLPVDVVRDIVSEYSWVQGKGATVNDIARKHKLPRAKVRDIIKALGKTHDSLGYTDEDIAEAQEDFLVEDQVRAKEQRVLVRAEKQRWDAIKRIAEEAERWDQFVFSRVSRMPVPEIPKPKKLAAVDRHGGKILTYVGLQDLHVGAYSVAEEVGPENIFSTKICRERVLDTLATAVQRVRCFGEIGQVVFPCGGDFFHIDTPGKTTTKGTPQDVDGPLPKILVDGFALAAEIVNYLAQASGSVQVLNSAGNHDHTMSLVLLQWLNVAFQNRGDVTVRPDMRPRQYYRFGSNLIGVTHGDGPKDAKLPMLMATEAKEHWSETRFRYWFSGHYHTQFANEHYGVQIHHHSSLKGNDTWHMNEGYVGNVVGMNMYVIDHDEGMLAHLPVAARK